MAVDFFAVDVPVPRELCSAMSPLSCSLLPDHQAFDQRVLPGGGLLVGQGAVLALLGRPRRARHGSGPGRRTPPRPASAPARQPRPYRAAAPAGGPRIPVSSPISALRRSRTARSDPGAAAGSGRGPPRRAPPAGLELVATGRVDQQRDVEDALQTGDRSEHVGFSEGQDVRRAAQPRREHGGARPPPPTSSPSRTRSPCAASSGRSRGAARAAAAISGSAATTSRSSCVLVVERLDDQLHAAAQLVEELGEPRLVRAQELLGDAPRLVGQHRAEAHGHHRVERLGQRVDDPVEGQEVGASDPGAARGRTGSRPPRPGRRHGAHRLRRPGPQVRPGPRCRRPPRRRRTSPGRHPPVTASVTLAAAAEVRVMQWTSGATTTSSPGGDARRRHRRRRHC